MFHSVTYICTGDDTKNHFKSTRPSNRTKLLAQHRPQVWVQSCTKVSRFYASMLASLQERERSRKVRFSTGYEMKRGTFIWYASPRSWPPASRMARPVRIITLSMISELVYTGSNGGRRWLTYLLLKGSAQSLPAI